MLTLVIGASGSGKSVFAEQYICDLQKQETDTNLLYVATMQPYGEETLKKIERHREQRKGKGFRSVDQYTQVERTNFVDEKTEVLLECLSNLLANEMYTEKRQGNVVERIFNGLEILEKKCHNLVIVTNDIFSEGIGDWEGSQQYLEALGTLNEKLAQRAEEVYQIVAGIPIARKKKEKGKETVIGKILVIGGAYQGKTKWAIEQFQLKEENVVDCRTQKVLDLDLKKEDALIVTHIEQLLWELFQQNKEEETIVESCCKEVEKLWIEKETCIFIVDEIGSGIVPLQKEQRIYRELVGRVSCRLAEQADQVYQIVAGCLNRLK